MQFIPQAVISTDGRESFVTVFYGNSEEARSGLLMTLTEPGEVNGSILFFDRPQEGNHVYRIDPEIGNSLLRMQLRILLLSYIFINNSPLNNNYNVH